LSAGLPPGPILELFAGAGHIGLLASVLTGRPLVQVEADPIAASFAIENAVRTGIAERVQVRHERVEDALMEDERFALILADPPYLRSDQVGRFPADPLMAIDGGGDGLDLVRATLDALSAHLNADGACLLQLAGPTQVRSVRRLVCDGWPALAVRASRSIDLERAVTHITRS
jgi:methylase of polypeptide subunit release factors